MPGGIVIVHRGATLLKGSWGEHPSGLAAGSGRDVLHRKDGQFRSGGLLVGDRPFCLKCLKNRPFQSALGDS